MAFSEPKLSIVEVGDPAEPERHWAQMERHRRNLKWLETHWDELLPQARGRFLAVADEQAFIAETAEACREWARKEHPGDDGMHVQYVLPHQGWRIYAGH